MRGVAAEDWGFLDETGANLAMGSRYGCAQRGQRVYAHQPKGRGKTLTILEAMSLKAGGLAGLSFTGGLTGDLFVWLIEPRLCLLLWPEAVVVMDNLPAHQVEGVKQVIEAVGARLINWTFASSFGDRNYCSTTTGYGIWRSLNAKTQSSRDSDTQQRQPDHPLSRCFGSWYRDEDALTITARGGISAFFYP